MLRRRVSIRPVINAGSYEHCAVTALARTVFNPISALHYQRHHTGTLADNLHSVGQQHKVDVQVTETWHFCWSGPDKKAVQMCPSRVGSRPPPFLISMKLEDEAGRLQLPELYLAIPANHSIR